MPDPSGNLGNARFDFRANLTPLQADLAKGEAMVTQSAQKMGAAAVVPVGNKAAAAGAFGAAAVGGAAGGAAAGGGVAGGIDRVTGKVRSLRSALNLVTFPIRFIGQIGVAAVAIAALQRAITNLTDKWVQLNNTLETVGGELSLKGTDSTREALDEIKRQRGELTAELQALQDSPILRRSIRAVAFGQTISSTQKAIAHLDREANAIAARIQQRELKQINDTLLELLREQRKVSDKILAGVAAVPSRLGPILELRGRMARR